MAEPDWLPHLIPFDWNDYIASLDRAYAVFTRDFGNGATRPAFRGRRLNFKRHPECEGRSATFWHLVTEGNDETSRTPVRERIERIAWPKPIILEAAATTPRVAVWRTSRGRNTRWVIAIEDFSYIVVLDDRGDFLLLWTAYTVAYDHQREKLRRECRTWHDSHRKS